MSKERGCCRWRYAVGILAIGLVACSLPAYAAMGPVSGTNTASAAVERPETDQGAPVALGKDLIRYAGNTLNELPEHYYNDGLRDTGVCTPPIGGEEPIPCPGGNPDCAGYGPGTCSGGTCDYPTPTACTTNSDCVGLGTGKCAYYPGLGGDYCEDQNYHYCPGGTEEGEWDLPTNGCGFPEDNYNGGCNATGGEAFGSVSCGETICGTAMLEVYGGQQRRDTDWYELVITEDTLVTMHGTAEFDWVMGMGHNHGDDSCANYDYYFWGGAYIVTDACTSGIADVCIHAGTWWIAVVPVWGGTIPCLDYEFTVECETPCQIACCIGNDVCIHTDQDTCEGTPMGAPQDTTSCGLVDCAWACDGDPLYEFPCNTEQNVDNTVNSEMANPPMSCASGDSIGLMWWWFTAENDSVQIATCNSVPAQGGDSVFALYSGDCYNTLTEVDCSEDTDCGAGNWLGIIDNCTLITGDTYWIQFAAWDSTSQGNYLVQIECPSPLCAPAACCLSDGSCITASRSICEAQPGGGNYQGAGSACEGDLDSNGIDDACEQGACCTGGTDCAPMSFGLCELTGGIDYIPGGTCEPNPCQGACCRKTGFPPSWQCTEVAQGGCVGTWYDGQECSAAEWPWFDCPDDAICTISNSETNCQRPVGDDQDVEGVVAVVSDLNPILVPQVSGPDAPLTQRIADDFIPHATGINLVCWWGMYNDINTNNPPPAPNCYLPASDFTVTFYMDDNGCPGTQVAQFGESLLPPNDLTVKETNAGWTTGDDDHQVWEYEGVLGDAVTVIPEDCYWIEIVNNTHDGSNPASQSCVWNWSVSLFSEGNGYSMIEDSASGPYDDCDPSAVGSGVQRWDHAFCLNVPNDPCEFCPEPFCDPISPKDDTCTNGYDDQVNQGCNVFDQDELPATTDLFTFIECGEAICGSYGNYEAQPECDTWEDCDPLEDCIDGRCTGDTAFFRDTDWYKFDLSPDGDYVEWCVLGEAPTLMGIINTYGEDVCNPALAWAALGVNPGCIGTCEGGNFAQGDHIWYGYVATTAFEGVPCGTKYDLCLDCGEGCGGPLPCVCEDARSCKDHAGTRHCITVGCDNGIEPRIGGVTEVEMDLDVPSATAVASVICTNGGDVTASATFGGMAGNTATVTFDPKLPDQDACVITLDCGASMCIRTCEGDMNQSGGTTTADALGVKIYFGSTVTSYPTVPENAQWDLNTSNSFTTADNLAVKIRFGFAAPACP